MLPFFSGWCSPFGVFLDQVLSISRSVTRCSQTGLCPTVLVTYHSHLPANLSPSQSDVTLPVARCRYKPVTVACHKPVTVACHKPVTVACHKPVTISRHKPVTVACHKPVTVACHKPVTVACHKPVTVARHKPVVCCSDASWDAQSGASEASR